MKAKAYVAFLLIPLCLNNFFNSPFYQVFSIFNLKQTFRNISYFSPDGLWGVEGLEGQFSLNLQKKDGLNLNGYLSLTAGETLIDKWLFNWQQTPLKLDIKGRLTPKAFFLEKGNLSLADSLCLKIRQVKGILNPLKGKISCLDLNITNLSSVYQNLIKIPLAEEYPFLNKIKLTGKLLLHVKNATYPFTQAELNCRFQGSVSLPFCQLKQIELVLPIFYHLEGQKIGQLKIETALLKSTKISHLNFLLASSCDQITLTQPVFISLYEGKLKIQRLTLLFPLILQGKISLGEIKPPFLPFPVSISSLLNFQLTPSYFQAMGKIEASVFGGKVWLEHLKLENPFSSMTKIKTDIYFEDIDLAILSQYLPFGKIQGVIRGHIKNLVLVQGQPESFDLVIESIKKKGKKQLISLTAANNIAILAQGHPMSISGLLPREFAYQKIGIRCTLKNDLFTIHGLIKKGQTEYLVKRKFLGINIINRSPGHPIAFKEMLERLRKIMKEVKQ